MECESGYPVQYNLQVDGNVVRILWCLIELEVMKLVLPITRRRKRVVGYPVRNRRNPSRLSRDYNK